MEDFVETIKKLNEERDALSESRKQEEAAKASRYMDAVDFFVSSLEMPIIEAIKKMTSEGKGYEPIFSFNRKSFMGEVFNASIHEGPRTEEEGYPLMLNTEHVLAGRWIPWVRDFYPERAVPIEQKILALVRSRCNGGIDPITSKEYIISVLWRKNTLRSAIPNGIIISRNGIKYGQVNDRTDRSRGRGSQGRGGQSKGRGQSRGSIALNVVDDIIVYD